MEKAGSKVRLHKSRAAAWVLRYEQRILSEFLVNAEEPSGSLRCGHDLTEGSRDLTLLDLLAQERT